MMQETKFFHTVYLAMKKSEPDVNENHIFFVYASRLYLYVETRSGKFLKKVEKGKFNV